MYHRTLLYLVGGGGGGVAGGSIQKERVGMSYAVQPQKAGAFVVLGGAR